MLTLIKQAKLNTRVQNKSGRTTTPAAVKDDKVNYTTQETTTGGDRSRRPHTGMALSNRPHSRAHATDNATDNYQRPQTVLRAMSLKHITVRANRA